MEVEIQTPTVSRRRLRRSVGRVRRARAIIGIGAALVVLGCVAPGTALAGLATPVVDGKSKPPSLRQQRLQDKQIRAAAEASAKLHLKASPQVVAVVEAAPIVVAVVSTTDTGWKDTLAPGASRVPQTPVNGACPRSWALDMFGTPTCRNDYVDNGDGVLGPGDWISGSGPDPEIYGIEAARAGRTYWQP